MIISDPKGHNIKNVYALRAYLNGYEYKEGITLSNEFKDKSRLYRKQGRSFYR